MTPRPVNAKPPNGRDNARYLNNFYQLEICQRQTSQPLIQQWFCNRNVPNLKHILNNDYHPRGLPIENVQANKFVAHYLNNLQEKRVPIGNLQWIK